MFKSVRQLSYDRKIEKFCTKTLQAEKKGFEPHSYLSQGSSICSVQKARFFLSFYLSLKRFSKFPAVHPIELVL